MSRRETDALVARLHPFGETSAVALVLTPDRGAIRVLAKGASRLKNSYRGPLDKGILYRARLGRSSGDGLRLLSSCTAREAFPRLRTDPTRFGAAALILESAADLLRENEPHPKLFRLVVYSLKVVDRAPQAKISVAVAFFLTRSVELSGHAPHLEACAACGEPFEDREPRLLSPVQGGISHRPCAEGEAAARPVAPAVLELWRFLRTRSADEIFRTDLGQAPLAQLQRHLLFWLEYFLERRFRAARAALDEFAVRPGGAG